MITFLRTTLLTTLTCLSFSANANTETESIFQTKNIVLIETTDESDRDIHSLVIV